MSKSLFYDLTVYFIVGLLLTGCETAQIYSNADHIVIRLDGDALADKGLAMLTPSTVTGKEEDKQVLALIFSETLKELRPDIQIQSLPHTLSAINQAGLAHTYKQMVIDHQVTGIFDKTKLNEIGSVIEGSYIVHLKLADFSQHSKGRFSALGIRLLETKQAHVRLFMQIWNSETATIAWEAYEEVSLAYDSGAEDLVSFNVVVKQAVSNLIGRLP